MKNSTFCLALPALVFFLTGTLVPQSVRPDVSGDWLAVFGDSASAGTLALHLNEGASGHVDGSYATTLGGTGTATGTLEGDSLSLTLTQASPRCPGSYSGVVTFSNGGAEGTFSGKDCLGSHENGIISLHRKGATATPPASIPHDKDGNVQPWTLVYENGQAFWLSRSDSAFLAVGASEAGGYFRLTVLAGNSTDEPVTFFPEAIRVDDINSGKSLPYTSPEKIAQKIEHRAALAAGMMAFGRSLQAYSGSMVTVRTTGRLSAYDNHGNWAQGNFYGTSTFRRPVDARERRAQAMQDNQAISERANRAVSTLTAGAARSQTIAPKSYMVGNVLFPKPRVANLKALVGRDYQTYSVKVIVPMNRDSFVFLFPVELLQALPHK
jgi:hypothetical protein